MAEARDGEEHKSSMALWDVLMTWREDWTKCGRSPKGLDKRIASVFDPNTHGQVRECIKMVEILHDMEKQLDILRLDKFGLRCGLDYILDTASQYAFETRVIRWNELIKARKRMVEVGLETQCIDEKITNVFKGPHEDVEKPEPLERAGITNPSSKTPNEKSATSTQGLSSSPNPLNAEPHTQEATHIADSKSTSTLKRSASVSVDAEKGSGRHSGPGVASEYKNHKKAKTEVASTDNGTEADGWEVPIKSIATGNMLLKADSNKSTLFLFYEATYKIFVCYHEKEGVAIKSDCPSINLKSISGVTREPLSSGPCFVRIETDVVNDEKRIFDIVLAQRDQAQAMLAKVKEIAGRDSVLDYDLQAKAPIERLVQGKRAKL